MHAREHGQQRESSTSPTTTPPTLSSCMHIFPSYKYTGAWQAYLFAAHLKRCSVHWAQKKTGIRSHWRHWHTVPSRGAACSGGGTGAALRRARPRTQPHALESVRPGRGTDRSQAMPESAWHVSSVTRAPGWSAAAKHFPPTRLYTGVFTWKRRTPHQQHLTTLARARNLASAPANDNSSP